MGSDIHQQQHYMPKDFDAQGIIHEPIGSCHLASSATTRSHRHYQNGLVKLLFINHPISPEDLGQIHEGILGSSGTECFVVYTPKSF